MIGKLSLNTEKHVALSLWPSCKTELCVISVTCVYVSRFEVTCISLRSCGGKY